MISDRHESLFGSGLSRLGKAKTATGLEVFTSILDKVFETKRKVADNFKETMRIRFDDYLPQWNYVAVPAGQEFSGFI